MKGRERMRLSNEYEWSDARGHKHFSFQNACKSGGKSMM